MQFFATSPCYHIDLFTMMGCSANSIFISFYIIYPRLPRQSKKIAFQGVVHKILDEIVIFL